VSTSVMLDRLQAATNPSYTIQRSWGGSCGGAGGTGGGGSANSPPGAGPSPSVNPMDPGVSVLAAGSAGPYLYEVIKVDPAMSDPAMVAIMWLKNNGYDVGMLGPDVLRPYLRDGLNLLAFKLTKSASTGSIRPVMLTYDTEHPMIPIRPTAVAANDDMGVLVWVLARGRTVPTNYRTLELNEALLDWFQPNMTYNAVISAAADEAGGQGFVTELAGSTIMRNIADVIYQERNNVTTFRQTADRQSAANLVVQVIGTFSTFSQGPNAGPGPFASRGGSGRVALDGVADLITTQLKLPPGVTANDVMAAPRCYFEEFRRPGDFYCEGRPTPPQVIDLTTFDKVKFLTELEKLVIQPLEKTSQLFRDQQYMTRFYTTMSARDMTLDPEFDLNAELGDVSNTHTLMMRYPSACFGDTSGKWDATLASGQVVHGEGNTWPFDIRAATMPVNLRVTQMSATGMGMVVKDNKATIDKVLAAPPPPGGSTPGTGGTGAGGPSGSGDASGGACAMVPGGRGAGMGMGMALLGIVGVGLAVMRRRRRR
jgi:hypothetical protein